MPYADPEAQARYQREWLASRRDAWIAANGPCARCGSAEDLEVDHVDSSKKVSHRIWGWSAERREAELAKCQVLCHPCHVDKTWNEDGRKRAQHGSDAMYDMGCRCDPCRARKSEKNALRYKPAGVAQ